MKNMIDVIQEARDRAQRMEAEARNQRLIREARHQRRKPQHAGKPAVA